MQRYILRAWTSAALIVENLSSSLNDSLSLSGSSIIHPRSDHTKSSVRPRKQCTTGVSVILNCPSTNRAINRSTNWRMSAKKRMDICGIRIRAPEGTSGAVIGLLAPLREPLASQPMLNRPGREGALIIASARTLTMEPLSPQTLSEDVL